MKFWFGKAIMFLFFIELFGNLKWNKIRNYFEFLDFSLANCTQSYKNLNSEFGITKSYLYFPWLMGKIGINLLWFFLSSFSLTLSFPKWWRLSLSTIFRVLDEVRFKKSSALEILKRTNFLLFIFFSSLLFSFSFLLFSFLVFSFLFFISFFFSPFALGFSFVWVELLGSLTFPSF